MKKNEFTRTLTATLAQNGKPNDDFIEKAVSKWGRVSRETSGAVDWDIKNIHNAVILYLEIKEAHEWATGILP